MRARSAFRGYEIAAAERLGPDRYRDYALARSRFQGVK